jgi:hypothetical protein
MLYNILVVDSKEFDLKNLTIMLEEYKESHNDTEKEIQIFESDTREDAFQRLREDNIDLIFIPIELESLAVQIHKEHLENQPLMVTISDDKETLIKEWFIDILFKPINIELLKLKFRFYMSVAEEKKKENHKFNRRIIYKIDSPDNLYFFWKLHFTSRWNLNRVISNLYIVVLKQLKRGKTSEIEISETENELKLFIRTEIDDFIKDLVSNLCNNKMSSNLSDNSIEFLISFDDQKQQEVEAIRENESFALENLDPESIDLLNDYMIQSSIAEDEDIKRDENDIKVFDFMNADDLTLFDKSISNIERLLFEYNNNEKKLDPKELRVLVVSMEGIKESLQSYRETIELSENIEALAKMILINMVKFQENGSEIVEDLISVITMLSTWHNSISQQGASSIDFMFKDIHEAIDWLKKKLD